jgi:hypothetical protein
MGWLSLVSPEVKRVQTAVWKSRVSDVTKALAGVIKWDWQAA